jgi:putative transposase
VFFFALRVKLRDEATVRSEPIYVALAVLPDGTRDLLGLWIEQFLPGDSAGGTPNLEP